MPTAQRVEDLKRYCADWATWREQAAKRRQHWLDLQGSGVTISDGTALDFLPKLVLDADAEVRQLHAIHIHMCSLRDRAINGEDV